MAESGRRLVPWRLLRWFILNQVILFSVFGLFVALVVWYGVTQRGPIEDFFYKLLFALLVILLLLSIGFSIWLARTLIYPLGRLLLKVRNNLDPEGAVSQTRRRWSDEPSQSEWLELERSFDRLAQDLKVKSEVLDREREELRAIMGAVSDAIVAVDPKGRLLFLNNQFAIQFGIDGSRAGKVSLPEAIRSPEVAEAFQRALREGKALTVHRSLYVQNSPFPRHFSISLSPLRHSLKEVYGAVGVFHDISEMKAAEQIRIDFVGNVSHELRTPLTSIKGYVQALNIDIKENRFDSMSQFLAVIERNVDRLIFLVNDLLDLSSLESGAQLQIDVVDAQQVTEAVLRQVQGDRARKEHIIKMKYGISDFFADTRRVEQVVLNLLQNAIKYVPEGKTIEINWDEDPKTKEVILEVIDNGPGIPLEHQPRLFERFYRVDEGRDRAVGGTGLGLAIVKHIMQRHGGSVSVQSQVGHGATFTCRFPRLKPH